MLMATCMHVTSATGWFLSLVFALETVDGSRFLCACEFERAVNGFAVGLVLSTACLKRRIGPNTQEPSSYLRFESLTLHSVSL
jgi:Ni,Fe-hydrogenase I cytochrome b subunit